MDPLTIIMSVLLGVFLFVAIEHGVAAWLIVARVRRAPSPSDPRGQFLSVRAVLRLALSRG